MPGTGLGSLLTGIRRLVLSDLSVEQPTLDSDTLSWVYPVNPEWLVRDRVAFSWATETLNGVAKAFDDDGGGTAGAPTVSSGAITIADNRWYTSCYVSLVGGAVTPISIYISVEDPAGNAFQQHVYDMPNPGEAVFGPFDVQGSEVWRIQTGTNGGVGDTMTVRVCGRTAPVGLPMVQVPLPTRQVE